MHVLILYILDCTRVALLYDHTVVSKALTASHRANMPPQDASALASFKASFKTDVAALLSLTADDIVVKSVTAGSVVVDFYVAPAADGSAAATPAELIAALGAGVTIAGSTTTAAVTGIYTVAAPPTATTSPTLAPQAESDDLSFATIVILVAVVLIGGTGVIVVCAVFRCLRGGSDSKPGLKGAVSTDNPIHAEMDMPMEME